MAEIVGATAAVIGATYGVYAGESQAKVQRKNIRRSKIAQLASENRAVSEARKAELANQREQKRSSQAIDSILLGEQGRGLPTLLTGSEGVDLQKLTLGRRTLLGAG